MNLINLWWLCLGALIGWLVQWIWDWVWLRARRRTVSVDVETQVAALQAERNKLTADLRICGDRRAALEGQVASLKLRVGELEPLAARVDALGAENDQFRARVGELEPLATRADALVAENNQLHARVGELEPHAARVASLSAENDQLRSRLAATRPAETAATTLAGAAGATLAAPDGAGDGPELLASLREYNLAMHDELDATRRALARYAGGKGDSLSDIDGIGPVYQKKLYEQGVVSFEQLAAIHPERLRAIVAPNAAFKLDTGSWVEQARRLSGRTVRDPLIDINGIGPVYEQRLLNAGVTSFEQLAGLSVEEILAIVKPASRQLVEPEAWIAEARELAEQVRAGTYHTREH